MSHRSGAYVLFGSMILTACGGGGGGGGSASGGGSSAGPNLTNSFVQAGANTNVTLDSQSIATASGELASADLRIAFDQSESLNEVTIATVTGETATDITITEANGSFQSAQAAIPQSLTFETVFPASDFSSLAQVARDDGTAQGIFSNALELGHDYLSFGAWETTSAQGQSESAVGVFGAEVTGTTYVSIIPENGQSVSFLDATYVGKSTGRLDGASSADTVSDVQLNVDFFQNSMTFSTLNTTVLSNNTAVRRADLDLTGTLSLNGVPDFSGNVTSTSGAMTGAATGSFFGDRDTRAAAVGSVAIPLEAGGTFRLSATDPNASDQQYIGAFGSRMLVFSSGQ